MCVCGTVEEFPGIMILRELNMAQYKNFGDGALVVQRLQ